MSEENIERIIEDYLGRTKKLLPSSPERTDLMEELREHIVQSFKDKMNLRSSHDKVMLIHEVLAELGTPEDIAEEYSQAGDVSKLIGEPQRTIWQIVGRPIIALIAVIVCSAIVHVYTNGRINFYFAVTVLLVFVVLEWFMRTWQSGD